MKKARSVDSPSISQNYSTPKTRGGNWCSRWTFWWYFIIFQWKPVILYLFPSESRWYFCSENDFFDFECISRLWEISSSIFHERLIYPKCYKVMFFDFRKFYFFHEKKCVLSTKVWFSSSRRHNRLIFRAKHIFFMKKNKFFENRRTSLYNILVKSAPREI